MRHSWGRCIGVCAWLQRRDDLIPTAARWAVVGRSSGMMAGRSLAGPLAWPLVRDERIPPMLRRRAGPSRRYHVNSRELLISICCASLAADPGGHASTGLRMDVNVDELQEAAPSLGTERALAETEVSSLNTFDHSRAVERRSRSARSEARRPEGQHQWGEQRAKQRSHGWPRSNMCRFRGW